MLWVAVAAFQASVIPTRPRVSMDGRRGLMSELDETKKVKKKKDPLVNPLNDPSRVKNKVVERPEAVELRERLANLDWRLTVACNNITNQLKDSPYAIVDNVYGAELCRAMRCEAEGLYKGMEAAQSTRWNPVSEAVEYYTKPAVFSTQIEGAGKYKDAPRLTEHVVKLTEVLAKAVNEMGVPVKPRHQTNKLAVCTGGGSEYLTHYDNSAGDDLRKVTALYYLNPDWQPEHKGEFRLYGPLPDAQPTDIAPVGDRLLVFWSDDLIHGVLPNLCESHKDHRYALTVWLLAENEKDIAAIDPAVEAHFFPQCQTKGEEASSLING